MTIENVKEPRTGRTWTPAVVNTHKLDVIFELRSKFGMQKGDVVKCVHTVPVRSMIDTKPVPRAKTETETEYLNIEGGSNVTYIGPEFDYWTGYMFLRFVYEDKVVHYNYWKQHQAGDTMFETTFKPITKQQA